jgi:cytochrome c oxidase subunit II
VDPSPPGNPSTTPETHPASGPPGPRGRPRGRRTRWVAALAVVAGGLLLAGCQLPTFGAHKAITSQGQDSMKLWQGFFIAGAVVFLLVFALIAWAVFRYRRRSDAIPRQTQYHTVVEILYTAIPIIIVLILFGFTFVTENRVDALPAPKLSVTVTGFQWGWRFQYTTKDVTVIGVELQDPEMVLPQNETVRISLESHDVIHGFYVPAFDFSRYAQPGIVNKFTVNLHTLGTFRGQCTQYCGLYHSLMRFRVKVVTPGQFAAWVSAHRSSASASNSTTGKVASVSSTSHTALTAATGGTGS